MKRTSKITKQENYLERLLKDLPVEAADKLRERMQSDADDFAKAVSENQGSTDPGFWANKSCSRCYGRGHHSTMFNHVNKELVGQKSYCSCVDKRFGKWVANFRVEYLANKRQERLSKEGQP